MPNRDDAIYDLLMNAKHAEPEPGVITAEVAILTYKAVSLCRDPAIEKLLKDLDAEADTQISKEIDTLGIPDGSPEREQIKNQIKTVRKAELSIANTEKITTALWAYLDTKPAKKGF